MLALKYYLNNSDEVVYCELKEFLNPDSQVLLMAIKHDTLDAIASNCIIRHLDFFDREVAIACFNGVANLMTRQHESHSKNHFTTTHVVFSNGGFVEIDNGIAFPEWLMASGLLGVSASSKFISMPQRFEQTEDGWKEKGVAINPEDIVPISYEAVQRVTMLSIYFLNKKT